MASTRAATGNSKPRVLTAISSGSGRTRTTKTTTKKPTAAAGVKKRAPATNHKRKTSIKDKAEGAVEKVIGTVEHKPGKKAAGTKKMRGTDGKNNRTAKKAVV